MAGEKQTVLTYVYLTKILSLSILTSLLELEILTYLVTCCCRASFSLHFSIRKKNKKIKGI